MRVSRCDYQSNRHNALDGQQGGRAVYTQRRETLDVYSGGKRQHMEYIVDDSSEGWCVCMCPECRLKPEGYGVYRKNGNGDTIIPKSSLHLDGTEGRPVIRVATKGKE